jgi:hypothetical protein
MADDGTKAIIETIIKAKVLEAFNSEEGLINKLIDSALTGKVDPNTGRPDQYGNTSRSISWLDWLVGDTIRHAASDAVRQYLNDSMPQVTAAVQARMSLPDMAEVIAKALTGVVGQDWKVKVSFERDR